MIFCVSFLNSKVLLDGLYDPDCSLNKLKRDKDGIARDYTHVLNNIWEYVTSDWQVVQRPKNVILLNRNDIIITTKGVKTYYQVYPEEPAAAAGEDS